MSKMYYNKLESIMLKG